VNLLSFNALLFQFFFEFSCLFFGKLFVFLMLLLQVSDSLSSLLLFNLSFFSDLLRVHPFLFRFLLLSLSSVSLLLLLIFLNRILFKLFLHLMSFSL